MTRGATTGSKKSKSARRRKQRAGVATAALMTAAMGATVTFGAGQASAISFGPLVECAGGSGTANKNVDCAWSIDPPVGELLPVLDLPIDLNSTAAAREDLHALWPFEDTVLFGGTTAKISGLGLAYANSQFASAGSTAEANAWGLLSAAVAVNMPQFNFSQNPGTTKATSLPLGVTIAFAGAGDASALAFGGFATAIGDVPLGLVENVSCMAIFAQASHSDVGSCTGLLFIFSVSQEAGSPEYVFAVADPTSFKLFNDGSGLIPLPIPSFERDILRIGVGGPSGIRVETDLFGSTGSSGAARTAAAPLSFDAPADDVPVADEEVSATDYVGKHRAPDATETETVVATETAEVTEKAEVSEKAEVTEKADGTAADIADPDEESTTESVTEPAAEPETQWTEPEPKTSTPSTSASSTDVGDTE